MADKIELQTGVIMIDGSGTGGAVIPIATPEKIALGELNNVVITPEGLKKSKVLYKPNLLINGDLRIAQRTPNLHTTPVAVPTTPNYIAFDGFMFGGTGTIQQYSQTAGGLIVTGDVRIVKRIEDRDYARIVRKKVTLSYVLNDVFHEETFPADIPDADGHGTVMDRILAPGKYNYFKLELGEFATENVPLSMPLDLVRCQRYYQTVAIIDVGSATSNAQNIAFSLPLQTKMRVNPTITGTPGDATNVSNLVVTPVTGNVQWSFFTLTSGSYRLIGTYTLDADIR